jgi:hypothetical protein
MKSISLKQILFYSVIITLFIIIGCKKDSNDNQTSKTELLSRVWKISSIEGSSDFFGTIGGTLQFYTTGDYDFKFTKPVGGWEQEEDKWNWYNNETILQVVFYGSKEDWTVTNLTKENFWFVEEGGAIIKCVPN